MSKPLLVSGSLGTIRLTLPSGDVIESTYAENEGYAFQDSSASIPSPTSSALTYDGIQSLRPRVAPSDTPSLSSLRPERSSKYEALMRVRED